MGSSPHPCCEAPLFGRRGVRIFGRGLNLALAVDVNVTVWQPEMVSVATSQTCAVRQGLFSCSNAREGICQYCGRPFCSRHGVFLEDAQEVCSRKPCVAKREDLVRHLEYKRVVLARNRNALCGFEQCESPMSEECSRCQRYFCASHAHPREENVLEHGVRVSRRTTLCHHCWARRSIWLRT
jgi:hypothetical protein